MQPEAAVESGSTVEKKDKEEEKDESEDDSESSEEEQTSSDEIEQENPTGSGNLLLNPPELLANFFILPLPFSF